MTKQAITAYSPILLGQAGYSEVKQNGLAGGLNTIGIIGTIISANIVDRIGRRVCLMGGSLALFAVFDCRCHFWFYNRSWHWD